MFSRSHINAYSLLSAFVVVVSTLSIPVHAGTFKICAEPDGLPMSQESSHSGFEIEAADVLAKEMGETLEVKWIPQRDHSFYRQTIGLGTCDALMSVPSDLKMVTTTKPWYRTGFEFVTRAKPASSITSFDDPKLKTLKIGIPVTGLGETPAALALTHRGLAPNLHPYSIYEPRALIEALEKKEIDLAIAFGPFAGWYAGADKSQVSFVPTPDRDGPLPFAFDFAIGVKKGNETLKKKLDGAIDRQKPALEAILKKWRVPTRAS